MSDSSSGMADPSSSSESTSPVTAYLIETSLFEAAAAVSLGLALLLLASSMPRVSAQPVASSKRFFHAVVTLCACLNLVKSIDNHQVFRRFASDAYIVIFLTNNITPALMLGGAVLIYNTIDVQYRINKSSTPRLLPALLAALSGSNFVVINTFTALAVIKLQQRYFLYLLWYLIVSFTVLLIIADISVANVRALVLKYQDRSAALASSANAGKAAAGSGGGTRAQSKMLAAEKSLYPLYGFVIFLNVLLAVVVAALIYQAITILSEHLQNDAPARANPREWELDVFAWVHVVAIWLFIWWSWVPLVVVSKALRKIGYARAGSSETDSSNVQMLRDSGTEAHGGTSAATHRATTTLHSTAGATGNGTARGFHATQSSGQILVQPRNGLTGSDSVRGNGNGLGSARGNGLGSARAHYNAAKPGEVISSARGSGSMGRVYERGLAATGRQPIGSPVRASNGHGLTPRTGDTLGPPASGYADSSLLLTPSPRTGMRSSSDAGAPAAAGSAKDGSPSSTLLPGQSSAALLSAGGASTTEREKDSLLSSGGGAGASTGGGGPPDVNRALSVNVSSKNNSVASVGGSRAGAGGAGATLAPSREQVPSARFSARHTNDVTELSVSREGDRDRPGGRLSERNSPVLAPAAASAQEHQPMMLSGSPMFSSSSAATAAAVASPSASPAAAATGATLLHSPSHHRGAIGAGSSGGGVIAASSRGTASMSAVHLEHSHLPGSPSANHGQKPRGSR